MAFSRCPNCEYVQWQFGASDGRPAGECPECSWEMQWTLTPLTSKERAASKDREDAREAAESRR